MLSSGAHGMGCLPGQTSGRTKIKSQLILRDKYHEVSLSLSQWDM
jgi:hypothetical protein